MIIIIVSNSKIVILQMYMYKLLAKKSQFILLKDYIISLFNELHLQYFLHF